MGLFITFAEPTALMKTEAASAGVLDTPFGKFARLPILNIEDLFAGKKPARQKDKTRQGKPGRVRETVPPRRPYMNSFSPSRPV